VWRERTVIDVELVILHKKETDDVVVKEKFTETVPGVGEGGMIVFKIRFAVLLVAEYI